MCNPTTQPFAGIAAAARSAILIACVAVIGSVSPSRAQSNMGKDFCVVFLSSEREFECDDSLMIFLTGPRNTAVRITAPGQPMTVVNVLAGKMAVYNAPCIPFGTDDLPSKMNRGVFINSDDSIAVVAQTIAREEGDAYGALPLTAWGTDYRVLSSRGTVKSAVLAAFDNTVVNYTIGGVPASVTLMKGDAQILKQGMATEILLHASQPVAVVGSGWERNASPIRYIDSSTLYEQYMPIQQWGNEFYTMPFDDQPDQLMPVAANTFVHVSAAYDSTDAIVDNLHHLMNAGEYYELPVAGFHHVLTTKPTLVSTWRASVLDAMTGDQFGGPRLTMIPSLSQYTRDVWFVCGDAVKSPEYAHSITIVHPLTNSDKVLLDGKLLAGVTWRPLSGGPFVGARVRVSRGAHRLQSSEAFGMIVYGADSAVRVWKDGRPFFYDGYAYYPGGVPIDTTNHTLGINPLAVVTNTCKPFVDTVMYVENPSINTVLITALKVMGADSLAFTSTSTLPITLQPFHAGTIAIRFAPRHVGISNATLVITAIGAGTPTYTVALRGRNDSVRIVAAPAAIDFGKLTTCGTSVRLLRIANAGTGTITMGDGNVIRPHATELAIPRMPTMPLAPGDTMAVIVNFTPTQAGVIDDSVGVTLGCVTVFVPVRGVAVTPALVMDSLDFGGICVGASATQRIVIDNPSDTAIVVTSRTLLAPFVVDSPAVPFTVPALGTALMRVRFDPVSDSSYSATLRIGGQPCNVAVQTTLAGRGGTPGVQVNDRDFGVLCSGDSAESAITLSNTGSQPVTVIRLVVAKPFTIDTASLPLTIGPSGSVMLRAVYRPTKAARDTQRVAVFAQPCDIGAAATFTGAMQAPALLATGIDFSEVCPGTTAVRNATLRNTGSAVITVRSAQVNPPFVIDSPAVPFAIPVGGSAEIRVRFQPQSAGTFTGTLTAHADPCGIVVSAALRGSAGTPALAMTGADFGTLCAGETASRTLVVRNTGTADSRIDAIRVSNTFVVRESCPLVVLAGDSVHLTVDFTPQTAAIYAADVAVFGSPCDVGAIAHLTGSGAVAGLAGSDADLDTILVGTSRDTVVRIVNTAQRPLLVDTLLIRSCPDCAFTIASTTAFVIAAGGSHDVAVHYEPANEGDDTITLCAVSHDVCNDSAQFTVIGHALKPVTPIVHLCSTTNVTAVVLDTFHVYVDLIDDLPPTPLDSFRVDLVFDRTVLAYRGGSAPAACPVQAALLGNGRLRCSAYCAALPKGLIYDATFVGLVTMADTAHTAVTLDSIVFSPQVADGEGCATLVTITPVCGLHGVGLTPSLTLSQNFPNPSSDATVLNVTVPPDERPTATLRVVGAVGQTVLDLTSQLRASTGAASSIAFSAAELPSGMYGCVLESNGLRVVRRMHVVR